MMYQQQDLNSFVNLLNLWLSTNKPPLQDWCDAKKNWAHAKHDGDGECINLYKKIKSTIIQEGNKNTSDVVHKLVTRTTYTG